MGLADHFGRALRDEKTTSGIAESTIWRLESADDGPIGGRAATGGAIREAVERAGVIFIEKNGAGRTIPPQSVL